MMYVQGVVQFIAAGIGGSCGGCCALLGKCECKCGAFARLAVDTYIAALGLDQLFDDCQSQSGAAGGAGARGIRPVESFEHKRQVLRSDADARVLDL